MRKSIRFWLSSAVVWLTVFGVTGVFAESQAPSTPVETHCIGTASLAVEADEEPVAITSKVFLPLVRSGGSVQSSEVAQSNCFPSFSEAIYAASNGAVRVDDNASPEEVEAAVAQSPSATIVIGILWSGSNFTGSTFTWSANNAVGCNTGLSYSVASSPSGWNDVTSSARSFGGCGKFYLYEHASFGGAARACNTSASCSGLGIMDNQSSSWRWYRSGNFY